VNGDLRVIMQKDHRPVRANRAHDGEVPGR